VAGAEAVAAGLAGMTADAIAVLAGKTAPFGRGLETIAEP
jgi:hypothetical protein